MAALDAGAVERAVTSFIVDNFLFGNASDAPKPSASFMESGLIDSTGVLELVAFVEDTWKISVVDDEMVPQNFDSIDALTVFVQKKTS